MKYLLLTAALSTLIIASGCSSEHSGEDHNMMDHNTATSSATGHEDGHTMDDMNDMTETEVTGAQAELSETLSLDTAYIQPPFPGRDVAAGFFLLQNTGEADRLIAASSPISGSVEIHTHLKEDGIMKMRRIEGVDIAEGQSVPFAPGTYHLMMFDTVLAPTDTHADVTLVFEKSGTHTVTLPIKGRDISKTDMSHDNH